LGFFALILRACKSTFFNPENLIKMVVFLVCFACLSGQAGTLGD
jgi:hypothetical protein